MEKFGVEEVESDDKTAQDKNDRPCPRCGAALRAKLETGVLLCPNCGSEPFEAPLETK
jgi:ribosomal protein L37AE/L43A